MKQTYESLCQMLKKEIKTIEQQPALTKESLELLKNITETMSNIKKIMKMEEEMEEKEASGMSSRNSYAGGMSNAQRRDSMGRYMDYDPMMMYHLGYEQGNSNNSYARGNSNNSYARGNSNNSYENSRNYNAYSRDDSRKKMVRKLETLMDDTMSEKERLAIQECMNKIEQ